MNRLRLLLPCLLLSASPAAFAQKDGNPAFYRIEVIVFTHAAGASDAWPVEALSSPQVAVDPAWKRFGQARAAARAEDGTAGEDPDLDNALAVIEALAELETTLQSLDELFTFPEPWLAVEEFSDPMRQALERLQGSGAYDVQAWLGWYQPLSSGNARQVRIHDRHPLTADWIELLPTGEIRRNDRAVNSAETLFPDFDYRLDGFVRIRQRQFMHADIQLEWRNRQSAGPLQLPVAEPPEPFAVHPLEHSRTVRPDRLEYFDSEWLGALVLVTPWQPEFESPSPEGADDGDTDREP